MLRDKGYIKVLGLSSWQPIHSSSRIMSGLFVQNCRDLAEEGMTDLQ